MVTKPKASELSAAIRANIGGPVPRVAESAAQPQDKTTRTTFAAPARLLVELRTLALRRHCTMNDLVLLAVGDLLASVGNPNRVPGVAEIRRKLGSASPESDDRGGD